jgi:hypothetical protein
MRVAAISVAKELLFFIGRSQLLAVSTGLNSEGAARQQRFAPQCEFRSLAG